MGRTLRGRAPHAATSPGAVGHPSSPPSSILRVYETLVRFMEPRGAAWVTPVGVSPDPRARPEQGTFSRRHVNTSTTNKRFPTIRVLVVSWRLLGAGVGRGALPVPVGETASRPGAVGKVPEALGAFPAKQSGPARPPPPLFPPMHTGNEGEKSQFFGTERCRRAASHPLRLPRGRIWGLPLGSSDGGASALLRLGLRGSRPRAAPRFWAQVVFGLRCPCGEAGEGGAEPGCSHPSGIGQRSLAVVMPCP